MKRTASQEAPESPVRGEAAETADRFPDAPRANVQALTIEIPLPPRELQPNNIAGRHPMALAKHKRQAKHDAKYATYAVLQGVAPGWTRVKAVAVFSFPQRRERDDDGMIGWLKWTRDQIAASLGMDGDNGWGWERPVIVIDYDRPARVTITVTPITEGE
jgi:hypothetical protein